MRFASIGSGSKGNGTLVETADGAVLIDCGFSVRMTRDRLRRLAIDPGRIRAVLVTHEHGDHSRGAVAVADALGVPLHCTVGTAHALGWNGVALRTIAGDLPFEVAGLSIQPVAVPHDAREPVQFVLSDGTATLGVLTDTGHISGHVLDCYRRCDALFVEFNHDPDRLRDGPYPAVVKARVAGPHGHLSNGQGVEFIHDLAGGSLRQVAIGHVSQQNNSAALVAAAVAALPAHLACGAVIATQDDGLGWQDVAPAG